MKISIITCVKNQTTYVEDCIRSVLGQTYGDIEYIIVDGASTDGTLEKVYKYRDRIAKVVSAPDNGMYEALNKGLAHATGDIVGILNSDDMYADKDVLSQVADCFRAHKSDSIYGELVYVDPVNTGRVLRYWHAGDFDLGLFKKGWMVPHPTFFVKRQVYEKYGNFNTKFKIAGDYELILRFLYRHMISTCYIKKVLVKMRWGGKSNRSISSMIRKSAEDYNICGMYGLGFSALFYKNILKIKQFFIRNQGEDGR